MEESILATTGIEYLQNNMRGQKIKPIDQTFSDDQDQNIYFQIIFHSKLFYLTSITYIIIFTLKLNNTYYRNMGQSQNNTTKTNKTRSTVSETRKPPPSTNNQLKIIIATVDSKEHNIEFNDNKTCYQLKQHIYKELSQSLEVGSMALEYAGVPLDDSKKLSYYRIVEHTGIRKIFQTKQSLDKIAGIVLAYEMDLFGIDEKKTVRMPCGHVIGRDGMTGFIRSLIDTHRFQIRCPGYKPNGQICQHEWDFAVCKKIGVFTVEQKKQFEEGLSQNWVNQNASECPKCQHKVIKGDLKSNRVMCPNCKYGDYCFSCSKKWVSNDANVCGNSTCYGINDVLKSCQWQKIFVLQTNEKLTSYKLPQFRMCPNAQCQILISHGKYCKHMTCTYCKTQFCYVCLSVKQKDKNWQCFGPFDYCGKIAQTQQIKI